MRAQLTSATSTTQAGETQLMTPVADESTMSPIETPIKGTELKQVQQQRLYTAGQLRRPGGAGNQSLITLKSMQEAELFDKDINSIVKLVNNIEKDY